MAASNPPKGSVSSSSIKPVTRKAVRCQREVAWLVTQAAGRLVATTQDVNALIAQGELEPTAPATSRNRKYRLLERVE